MKKPFYAGHVENKCAIFSHCTTGENIVVRDVGGFTFFSSYNRVKNTRNRGSLTTIFFHNDCPENIITPRHRWSCRLRYPWIRACRVASMLRARRSRNTACVNAFGYRADVRQCVTIYRRFPPRGFSADEPGRRRSFHVVAAAAPAVSRSSGR